MKMPKLKKDLILTTNNKNLVNIHLHSLRALFELQNRLQSHKSEIGERKNMILYSAYPTTPHKTTFLKVFLLKVVFKKSTLLGNERVEYL